MSEFDRLKAQKESILERDADRSPVFEIVTEALRVGAPGLSDLIKQGIARSITMRIAANLETLRFELKAARNEIDIAAGEIARLKAQPSDGGVAGEPVAETRFITAADREYASELLADLTSDDLPRLEIAARWFRKARVETALARALPPVPGNEGREAMVPKSLLNERDDFIVSKGLWSEFISSLPRSERASQGK